MVSYIGWVKKKQEKEKKLLTPTPLKKTTKIKKLKNYRSIGTCLPPLAAIAGGYR